MLLPISIFTPGFQGSDRPAIPPNQPAGCGGGGGGLRAPCAHQTVPASLKVQVLLPDPLAHSAPWPLHAIPSGMASFTTYL